MNRDARRGRIDERGFTLLEMMISMSLILLVTLVTLGAMRLGYRSVESGDARINAQERFRTSLNVIDAQIQSAIAIGWKEKEEDIEKVYFKGTEDNLRFSSNVSIWDGRRGYLIVDYRVEQGLDGKKRLMASENTVGMANRRETLLLDAMDEIRFEYLTSGVVEAASWMSQWTDAASIPEKIKIHLAYRGRDFSTLIPVRVRQAESRPVTSTGRSSSAAGVSSAK